MGKRNGRGDQDAAVYDNHSSAVCYLQLCEREVGEDMVDQDLAWFGPSILR